MTKIRRETTATGASLYFPARQLPPTLRNFGAMVFGMGVVFLGAGAFAALGLGATRLGGWGAALWALAGCGAMVLGLLLTKSRTVVELGGDGMRIKEKVGIIAVRRAFRFAELGDFRIEMLPLQRGAAPVPVGGPAPAGAVAILSAEVRGKGRQVLVFGYPEDVMKDALAEIRSRRPQGSRA